MSGVRRKLLTWGVLAAGLFLAGSACGYLVRTMTPRPERYNSYTSTMPARATTRADLLNRTPPAFNGASRPDPRAAAEFAPLFDELAAAARLGDGAGYAALWDCDRFAEEVWMQVASWTGAAPTNLQVQSVATEARQTLTIRGREPTQVFRADRTEVVRVAYSPNRQEALVVARHTVRENGVPTVYGTRWWLTRGPGGRWKVYDRDVPLTRLRASFRLAGLEWERVTGAVDPGAVAGLPPGAEPPTPIRGVIAALEGPIEGSPFETEEALNLCRGADLPRPWAAARAVAHGRLHLQQGEPGKALTELDKANGLVPGFARTFPQALHVRAAAASRLGDYRAALTNAVQYRDAVGGDADAVLLVGLALEKTGRPVPALREYRAAVTDFPGRDPLYPALARVLPAGQKREAGALAAKGPRPADHLRAILAAPEAADATVADEVTAGFLTARPDDPHGLAAAAVVRGRQGKGSDATVLLRRAREVAADDQRPAVRTGYLVGVLRHGVPLAGYRAVPTPDRPAAFRRLADELRGRMDGVGSPAAGVLLALVAAHRAAAPADPWGEFWTAELLAEGGRPERAEEVLAAAMGRLPKPARTARKTLPDHPLVHDLTDGELAWDRFRGRRAHYLVRLGRWRDAYRELPPAVDTFDDLAFALDGAGDAAGLAELVATHRKAVPTDAEAIFWQGQVHWRRQETEQAVKLFAAYRAVAGEPAFQTWRADENRVRGLVRLGRPRRGKCLGRRTS